MHAYNILEIIVKSIQRDFMNHSPFRIQLMANQHICHHWHTPQCPINASAIQTECTGEGQSQIKRYL